jgi:hypothetical protein
VRPDEAPSVGDHRVRPGHLHGRYRDAVTDRHGADRRARPLVERKREPRRLARKVDPGRLPEPEAVDPQGEPALAEALRDRDRPDVRRVLDDLAHGHVFGAARVGLTDRAIGDLQGRGQAERRTRAYHSFLQSGGDGHELERRAGLVGVRDRAVAAPVGTRLAEAIRVEARRGRHREDFAGLRVHHDCGRRPRRPAADGVREDLLRVRLDLTVDREPDVLARRLGLRLDHVERSAERILDDGLASGRPGERLLQRALQALEADVVESGIPEDLRGDRALRIETKLLRIEAEAGVLELLQLLGLSRIRLALEVHEPTGAVR